MLDPNYEVPGTDICEVTITPEAVRGTGQFLYRRREETEEQMGSKKSKIAQEQTSGFREANVNV